MGGTPDVIGDIRLGKARFLRGDVWNSWNPIGRYIQESPTDPEARLRSWGLDRALSGDILVEQCIHSIDIVAWILGRNSWADGFLRRTRSGLG
jgi:predicted dehydrogenase